jgi:hypothetical protein
MGPLGAFENIVAQWIGRFAHWVGVMGHAIDHNIMDPRGIPYDFPLPMIILVRSDYYFSFPHLYAYWVFDLVFVHIWFSDSVQSRMQIVGMCIVGP